MGTVGDGSGKFREICPRAPWVLRNLCGKLTDGLACSPEVLDPRPALRVKGNRVARRVHFPPFELDLAAGRLTRGERPVALRPKTFAVLCYLVSRPGELVTKEALLDAVWGDVVVTEDVARVSIRELRRALDDDPEHPRFIETVHGRGYRFVARIAEEGASLPAFSRTGSTVVGRDTELSTLRAWLAEVRAGERIVGLVAGDAGIGKTTLLEAFLAELAPAAVWVGRSECREPLGVIEPYLPLLEALGQLGSGPAAERLRVSLATHAPMWLAQLPALLDAAQAEQLRTRLAGATGQRMVRELAGWAEAVAADALLVLVLEDLHWADRATLEVLSALAHGRARAQLLVLGTYRPIDAIVAAHPLVGIRTELLRRKLSRELLLSGLGRPAIARYLADRGAGAAPEPLVDFVHERSEGNPFFMVALLDHLLARGVVRISADGWQLEAGDALAQAGIPDSLRAMLVREVDTVDAATRDVLDVASVVGVEFAAQAVAAGCAGGSVEQVEDACDALARQGRVLHAVGESEWRDGTAGARYAFRHALYRDVVYERMSRARRRRLHQLIGERLEQGYGASAGTIASELAAHFEQGRDFDRALEYLRQTAETAQRRFADREALVSIDRALMLLAEVPDSPERRQRELLLRFTQGSSFLVARGHSDPDLAASCERVRVLCEDLGDVPAHLFAVLLLFVFDLMRGRLDAARDLGDRAIDLATRVLPALAAVGRVAAGLPRCYLGQLEEGVRHLEAAEAADVPREWPSTFDPLLHALGNLTESALVQLGRPEQAIARAAMLQARAEHLGHPFGLAFASHVQGRLYVLLREPAAALAHARRTIAICDQHGLDAELRVRSTLVRGWAETVLDQRRGLVQELRTQLAGFGERVSMVLVTAFHLMVAEVALAEGCLADARELVEAAAALATGTGERIEEAEIHRWRARLALAAGGAEACQAAKTHLHRALEVARRQGARWFELRAAVDLARVWAENGRTPQARDLVARALAPFTAAPDLPDLRAARALAAG